MKKQWGTYATPEGCEIYEVQGGMKPRGKTIAYVVGQEDKTWVQDARLIAACPEMLEVLKGFQGAWDENRLLTSDEAAAIRAAIQKAEGK